MSQSWHRVEPNARDEDLEEGLRGAIADPLWLLARQWQLGEFRGEDAASPIHARAVIESDPIATFHNRAARGATPEPWTPDLVLECRVEAERVSDGPAAVSLAVEAGLRFLRRLDAAQLHPIRSRVAWTSRFGFDPIADDPTLPLRERQRLTLVSRRALDGRKLLRATEADVQGMVAAVDASAWPAVAAELAAWRATETRQIEEPAADDCWVDPKLAYAFALGFSTAAGEVTLAAEGYPGGHLDWHAFSVEQAPSTASPTSSASTVTVERMPTPVSFRGQPAPRWWELEERSVYFGNLAAGPADIARVIVAEFATVFSDDWFVIPIELASGTLSRVSALDVIDVFGGQTRIAATAVADRAAATPRPWAFFELAGDRSASHGLAPYLFLPPVLASSLSGPAVEHVTFVRDEAANVAWAIEQTIELATGASMRRRQSWDDAASAAASTETSEAWRYRVQPSVPPWWIPLIPERIGTGAQIRLRRGRMQAWEELPPGQAGARGRVMGVQRALRFFEEEIPRGGIHVERAWQLARGTDGSTHLWMARHKRPGRGDRGSGLRFDHLDR